MNVGDNLTVWRCNLHAYSADIQFDRCYIHLYSPHSFILALSGFVLAHAITVHLPYPVRLLLRADFPMPHGSVPPGATDPHGIRIL